MAPEPAVAPEPAEKPEAVEKPFKTVVLPPIERRPAPEPATGPRVWGWMALGLTLFAIGLLIGFSLAWVKFPVREPAPQYPLALAVETRDSVSSIRWNPASVLVQAAGGGTLEVTESGNVMRVPLDKAQLQAGSAVFRSTGVVSRFRLELALGPTSASEVVELTPPPVAAEKEPPAEPVVARKKGRAKRTKN
ncbi:MAG: hypothetical protein FJW40_25060 [Acidobacteria bacterium]|nr:hypothetical protein [Acidobacteriota bacterium]